MYLLYNKIKEKKRVEEIIENKDRIYGYNN